jgi:hypothetical protein
MASSEQIAGAGFSDYVLEFSSNWRRMRCYAKLSKGALTIFLALQTVCVYADFVSVLTDTSGGKTYERKVYDGLEKVRIDMEGISLIRDHRTGEMIRLDPVRKTYRLFSGDVFEAILKARLKAEYPGANVDVGEAIPVPTGGKETINGRLAFEYRYSNAFITGTCWVVPDYPGAAGIAQFRKSVRKIERHTALNVLSGDFSTIPGVIVKAVETTRGNTSKSDLISLDEEVVDPVKYKVPPDYAEIKGSAKSQTSGPRPSPSR